MKNTRFISLTTIGLGVAVLVLIFFAFKAAAPAVEEDDVTMCTADAMQCPDGSYVGRSGVNCEFVCPESEVDIEPEVIAHSDIQVAAPAPGTVVTSPLQLSGEAKGSWYFEASAPVEIRDWQGNMIAQSFVTAQGDWMTVNFVPFTGTITFTSPYTPGDPVTWKQGTLVFKKDNPSGLPQNDDQISIPIQFAP